MLCSQKFSKKNPGFVCASNSLNLGLMEKNDLVIYTNLVPKQHMIKLLVEIFLEGSEEDKSNGVNYNDDNRAFEEFALRYSEETNQLLHGQKARSSKRMFVQLNLLQRNILFAQS